MNSECFSSLQNSSIRIINQLESYKEALALVSLEFLSGSDRSSVAVLFIVLHMSLESIVCGVNCLQCEQVDPS